MYYEIVRYLHQRGKAHVLLNSHLLGKRELRLTNGDATYLLFSDKGRSKSVKIISVALTSTVLISFFVQKALENHENSTRKMKLSSILGSNLYSNKSFLATSSSSKSQSANLNFPLIEDNEIPSKDFEEKSWMDLFNKFLVLKIENINYKTTKYINQFSIVRISRALSNGIIVAIDYKLNYFLYGPSATKTKKELQKGESDIDHSSTTGKRGNNNEKNQTANYIKSIAENNGLVNKDNKQGELVDEGETISYEERLRMVNLRTAKRMLLVCQSLGGVYLKFGQYIGSLNRLLPAEFTDTLSELQDSNPGVDFEEIKRLFVEEFDVPISKLFSKFTEKPIAAASIAQVHDATTHDGHRVAVKVQYPGLRKQIGIDIWTLKTMAGWLGFFFKDYEYTWLFPEFEKTMDLEVDFLQEAITSERVNRLLQSASGLGYKVKIPNIYWPLCSRRILTMEFIDGLKVTDIEKLDKNKIDRVAVGNALSALFSDMIFRIGIVHCDPHPGNIMVRPLSNENQAKSTHKFYANVFGVNINTKVTFWKAFFPLISISFGDNKEENTNISEIKSKEPLKTAPLARTMTKAMSNIFSSPSQSNGSQSSSGRFSDFEIILLDHGMYRRLDENFRRNYCNLWRACLTRDIKLGAESTSGLGLRPQYFELLSLISVNRTPDSRGKLGEGMKREELIRLRKKYKDANLATPEELQNIIQGLPRDLLFVFRTNSLVRSVNYALGVHNRNRFSTFGKSAALGVTIPADLTIPKEGYFLYERRPVQKIVANKLGIKTESDEGFPKDFQNNNDIVYIAKKDLLSSPNAGVNHTCIAELVFVRNTTYDTVNTNLNSQEIVLGENLSQDNEEDHIKKDSGKGNFHGNKLSTKPPFNFDNHNVYDYHTKYQNSYEGKYRQKKSPQSNSTWKIGTDFFSRLKSNLERKWIAYDFWLRVILVDYVISKSPVKNSTNTFSSFEEKERSSNGESISEGQ